MDLNRKLWNQGHQRFRNALVANDHRKAIELFLDQHAMVHSAKVAKSRLWSFEDEVLTNITESQIRCVPSGGDHSIAWILFHIARIEDITMNMLVAGTAQLFVQDHWAEKLNISIFHSANKMERRDVAFLSDQLHIDALRSYREAVARKTHATVKRLKLEEFKQKVEASRLQNVIDEGALVPEAISILNYWSKRTIGGLLLMPPTRHNFLHLNEALRIKQKL